MSHGSLLAQRRTSTRTQMIIGTITILTLVLVLFGVFVRYVVSTTLIESVDRDLLDRTDHLPRPAPPRPSDFNGGGGPWPDDIQPPGAPDLSAGSPMGGYRGGFGQNGPNQNEPPPGDPPDNPGPPPDFQDDNHGPTDQPRQDNRLPDMRSEDEGLRPHRFDSSGKSLDGFDQVTALSVNDIKLVAFVNHPIYSTITNNGEQIRILTRPHRQRDGGVDYIQAAYPLAQVNDAIDGVNKALIILIPIALVMAAFGGSLVTKSVFDRVGQMVKSTSTISANDLSQRLPVVGRDEFAELAETFNALIGRVESAFEEQEKIVELQRRFTADASHELKTPLTVIRGTTSLALSGNGTLDRQSTADIDSAAASMADLVQDLIYLARSDAEQLARKKIDILLLEPLQRAVAQVSLISEAPIRLELIDPSVDVTADESEICRLFTNILQNASQHTGPEGQIVALLSSTPEEAIVVVKDTGSGISAKHIPHLFERFYRVDSARSRDIGGSGLGLSICKGIVDAHGGTISINSSPGKGTEVTVILSRKNIYPPG